MSQFIEDLQYRIKTSSSSLFLSLAKIFIGLVMGLTFALMGQQMINYVDLSFLLVTVITIATFYRIARGWKWAHTLVFALVCVLIALLLKMYIMIAPGA